MLARNAPRAAPLMGGKRLLLLELYHGGHHPMYLASLLSEWERHSTTDELHLVLSEGYQREHEPLLDSVELTPRAQAHLVPLPVRSSGSSRQSLLATDRLHGRIAAEYASRLRADELLFMYFDHAQTSLARGLRFAWPLRISGIYFRPTFHYRALGMGGSRGERIAAHRKRLVLAAALRNPHVRTVFSLDPFAVEHVAARTRHVEAVHLPEPLQVPRPGPVRAPPVLARVEAGRRRLLLFGSLDDRKGIRPVLAALARLPESMQSRLALVLAGRIVGRERDVLLRRICEFRESTRVQVHVDDRLLEEEEIQPLIEASDLVLLTYDRHVGSSGVLIRAAAAGVPVLSTDYGLLGAQVVRHRLGTTVDATSAEAISSKIAAWLESPAAISLEADSARAFASANTVEAFAETIFSRMLGSAAPVRVSEQADHDIEPDARPHDHARRRGNG
jgi:glycosyltransferase involved in cell wall biosynthesis